MWEWINGPFLGGWIIGVARREEAAVRCGWISATLFLTCEGIVFDDWSVDSVETLLFRDGLDAKRLHGVQVLYDYWRKGHSTQRPPATICP